MNWLDILLLLPLLVGLVRGLMRGLVSEVIAIAVVILGVLGSKLWAPPFSKWLLTQFSWPQQVCDVVAYLLIFLAIAILLSIAAHWMTKVLSAIHLGWANRLGGAVFGVAKYGLILLFVVMIMDRTNQAYHWLDDSPVVKSSVVYPYMTKIANDILSFTGSEFGKP